MSNSNDYIYHRSGFGESATTFARVTVAGKDISKKNSIKVKIQQKMLEHTTFELTCPSEAFKDKETYPLKNSIKLLGSNVTIEFRKKGQTISEFTGLVTCVDYKKNHKYPFIIIHGTSYSALLDNQKECRTYHNKTLQDILQDVIKEYHGVKIDFICQPNNQNIIPYTISYNETPYEFIKRLAIRYGEFLFWNGSTLIFGRGSQKNIELKEGRDYLDYRLSAGIAPQHLIYENYNPQSAQVQKVVSKDAGTKVNLFQEEAVDSAHKIYMKSIHSVYYDALSEEEDYHLQQKITEHQEALENLVTLQAETTHASLRLGDLAKMSAYIPEFERDKSSGTPIESYLIMQIEHTYNSQGYKNSFTAIPREQQIAPYWDRNAFPKAEDQSAFVIDNNDPLALNRLKIKFPWQKEQDKTTSWVRFLQNYGGSDRGMHILPEKGDEVFVTFRGGNAEVPMVISSLNNGAQKSGYHTPDNRFKTLHTKDGEQLILEGKKNIILSDEKGNKFHIEIENDTITINGLHAIHLKAPYIHLDAEKDITLNAGNNISQNSGNNTHLTSGGSTEISANKELDMYGKNKLIGYTDGKTEWGAKQQMHVYGGSSLITAKSQIDYQAPNMRKLPQPGEFEYIKNGEVQEVYWINSNKEKIEYLDEESAGIYAKIKNGREGEFVKFFVEELNIKNEKIRDSEYSGTINNKGEVILKKVFNFKNEEL